MFWSYFLMSFPMLLLFVANLELFRVVAGQFCQQGVFKPNKEPKPLGMENFDIANSQITASTAYATYQLAYFGRLNSYTIPGFRDSAWASAVLDTNQWLQVNFLQSATVVKISTQGRADFVDQWVASYTVSYSNDGVNFQSYQENGQTKVFSGNSDRNSSVTHTLSVNIVAQFIRIQPQTWTNHIAMRAEFYGSYPGPTPLGMENFQILNSQITASSVWDSRYEPHAGRLNFKKNSRGSDGSWVASITDANQWLQVDFLRNTTVVQISTQGRNDDNEWILSYKISSSNDGTNFQFYQKTSGETMVFSGNTDADTVVSHSLSPVIAARFVRVHPQTWVNYVSMRVEFYSWSKALKPLGMENYQILDSQLDASSSYHPSEGPHVGRLNLQSTEINGDAWVARHLDQNQWLQVDFLLKMTVAAIGTQGRANGDSWSTSYKVSSSNNGVDFQFYKQNGQTTEFTGNTDKSSVVLNALVPVVTARFLRIHVTGWQGWIVLRAEFYGWHEANFASFHASSYFDCSQQCTGTTSCVSFDFRRVSNQNEINCKLNDVKEDLKTDAERAGWGHYERQDFSKMPCPSNHLCRFGKCVVDSCDPKGYRCECNESYKGELCEVAI